MTSFHSKSPSFHVRPPSFSCHVAIKIVIRAEGEGPDEDGQAKAAHAQHGLGNTGGLQGESTKGVPQHGWFTLENPYLKWDARGGVPSFWQTSTLKPWFSIGRSTGVAQWFSIA